jgi:uncharacterized protein (DUF1697 family)
MAELRAAVEGLGYGRVRTLLNSGNVVFTAPDDAEATDGAAERIERAVAERTGVASRVTVLTGGEVAAVVAGCPVTGEFDPSRLLVAVVRDPALLQRLAPLRAEEWAPDALGVGTRAAYLHCAGGILESRLPDAVGRLLGDGVTTRNWATLSRLHALVAA